MNETFSSVAEDSCIDERYEFDAPRFHDFLAQSPGGADVWFDRSDDGESMALDSESEQATEAMDIDASVGRNPVAQADVSVSMSSSASMNSGPVGMTSSGHASQEAGLAEQVVGEDIGYVTPRRPKERPHTQQQPERKGFGDAAKRIRVGQESNVSIKRQKVHPDCHARISFVEGKGSKSGVDPKMPKLATSARARPPKYKGRAQLEEEELAAVPKFKAQPFRLHSAKQRASSVPPRDPKPAPSNTLADRGFAKPASGSAPFVFKAGNQTSTHRRNSSGITQQKPFNLQTDLRGQRSREHLEARKEAREEQAKAAFHAQELPLSTYRAPTLHPKVPVFTLPEPFNLRSERRHEQACEMLDLRSQQEEERRQEEAQFKARLTPRGEPFRPLKSGALLTIPDEVILPGDIRSKQRAEFDAAMAKKERRLEEEKAVADAERQAREAEEIREIRRRSQFKARPMPIYKTTSWELKLPPPQWTEPHEPKLATDARASARSTPREGLQKQSTL